MKDLILPIIICIVLVGIGYWVFNNPNGIGNGVSNGGTTVNTKVSNFNYSGVVAPGTGQTAP
jgi:hypothetical protein